MSPFTGKEREDILSVKEILEAFLPYSDGWFVAGSFIPTLLQSKKSIENAPPGIDVFCLDGYEPDGVKFLPGSYFQATMESFYDFTDGDVTQASEYKLLSGYSVRWFKTKYSSRRNFTDRADFLHCTPTFHYDYLEGKFTLRISRGAYEAAVNKNLIRNKKAKYKPKLERINKFRNRGFNGLEQRHQDSDGSMDFFAAGQGFDKLVPALI